MGSFNLTCAITKAPILEGQKVRVFFLVSTGGYKNNGFNGCNCYPEDAYQVLGFPIKSEYADYGRYTLDEDSIEAQITLKIILDNYLENIVEEGKSIEDYNKYHDHMNVSLDDLDWYKIQDMMHSGRLFISTSKNKAHVAFMAVHEDVYQKMIEGNVKELAKKINFISEEDFKSHKEQLVSINEIVEETMVVGHKFKKRRQLKLTEKNIEETLLIYRKELENRCTGINIPKEDIEKSINEALAKVAVGEIISLKEEVICTEENIEESKEYILNDLMRLSIDPVSKNIDRQISNNRQHYGLYDVKTLLNETDYGKLFAESSFVRDWLFSMNMMYSPTLTSGQYHDYKDHAKTLKELADIVIKLKS